MNPITEAEIESLEPQLATIARRVLAGESQAAIAKTTGTSQWSISVKVAQIEKRLGKSLPRAPRVSRRKAGDYEREQAFAAKIASVPRCKCGLRHERCDLNIDHFGGARRSG